MSIEYNSRADTLESLLDHLALGWEIQLTKWDNRPAYPISALPSKFLPACVDPDCPDVAIAHIHMYG